MCNLCLGGYFSEMERMSDVLQLETVAIPIMRPKSNSTLGSNSSSSLTNLTSINAAINYGKVKYFKTPEMIGLKKLNRNPRDIILVSVLVSSSQS